MSHVDEASPGKQLSDRVVSTLRTVVPKLWGLAAGALLAWLGVHAPWVVTVLDWLGIDLDGVAAVVAVIALAEVVWYWAWRWIEPRVPNWLTRIVLGSSRQPTYAPLVNGVPVITTLPALDAADRARLTELRQLLGEIGSDDPALPALDKVLAQEPAI